MKNKKTRRFSLSVLALVLVILALLAIPASAGIADYSVKYSSQNCGCGTDPGFVASFAAYTFDTGDEGIVVTEIDHESSNCTLCTTYNSATAWYYPNATSNAYNTKHATESHYGTHSSVASNHIGATGEQFIFCIEGNHTARTTCNVTGETTYTKYTCAGDPGLR
ncbi:MAG: hypothetical protein IJY86_08995 [Clostridia bacterium]|nr:hypothetical protein [Clostridia bacterium]